MLILLIIIIITDRVRIQEHVSEYGVHWNFFFTLACISLLAGLCNVPESYSAIVGAILIVGMFVHTSTLYTLHSTPYTLHNNIFL